MAAYPCITVGTPEYQEIVIQILLVFQSLPEPEWPGVGSIMWEDETIGYQELTGWLYNWSEVYYRCRMNRVGHPDHWKHANRYMGLLLATNSPLLYPSTSLFAMADYVIFGALDFPSENGDILAAAELFKTASSVYYTFCENKLRDSGHVATLGPRKPFPNSVMVHPRDKALFIRLGGRYTMGLWKIWKACWESLMTSDAAPDDRIRQAAKEAYEAMSQASHDAASLAYTSLADNSPNPDFA
ncbi:hypothetical protein O1611_g1193 [Lasiodiplodia mahajangana]|uniref:Uncharacterized protein n=1 Tax=Lasiodiplodia mahajangana TaxID=1108764 RepID=A0ACC2JY76_9PEZI|nr:hypothetical protein O1611_g1193 [Lasiodiplodia mahajangana]